MLEEMPWRSSKHYSPAVTTGTTATGTTAIVTGIATTATGTGTATVTTAIGTTVTDLGNYQ